MRRARSVKQVLCVICVAAIGCGGFVPAAASAGDLREAMKIAAAQAATQAATQAPERQPALSPAFKWTAVGLLSMSAANLVIGLLGNSSNCDDFGCSDEHLKGAAILGAAGLTVVAIGYAKATQAQQQTTAAVEEEEEEEEAKDEDADASTPRRGIHPGLKWTAVGLFGGSALWLGMSTATEARGCNGIGCDRGMRRLAGGMAAAGGTLLVIGAVASSKSKSAPSIAIHRDGFAIQHRIRF